MKNLYFTFALIISFSLSSFAISNTAEISIVKKTPCDVAFLGIHSDRVSHRKAEILGFNNPNGVYVTQVLPNTAAEKAGLKPFDYILAVGQHELTHNRGLSGALAHFEPNDEAKIFFIRQGKEQSANVRFGSKGTWSHAKPSIKKSFLGVQSIGQNDQGIKVNVIQKTTAEAIGLQDGDIITAIDDIPMIDWSDLTIMMKNKAAGDAIQINYIRNGETKTTSGELNSYKNYSKARASNYEEKLDRVAKKIEKWSENVEIEEITEDIEIEVEELTNEIENRLEEFFNKNRDENERDEDNDENNNDRSGNLDNNDIRLNKNPRARMETPAPRPDVSTLSANVTKASVDELMNLNTGNESIAGLDNNLQIEAISFIPNTDSGMFDLEFNLNQTGNTIVQLFNNSGRMIYEYELGGFSGIFNDAIDVSQNAPGVYYLIVKQNDQTATRKVQFEVQ